jgi:cytosine/adenosine deaminase-related metal-dependent hydrolase
MPADLAIRNGMAITCGPAGTVRADVLIVGGRIVEVAPRVGPAAREIDATGCLVLPGFVQTHVHLCQTLMRGLAEDLDVMEWLRRWVWPLEQALDAPAMAASSRLGVAEMLVSGTTTFLSMETVRHTDEAFTAAADLGARAVVGKALMDHREPGTPLLGESTEEAFADLTRLYETWHGADGGRLRVAVAPRAPRGATPELWIRGVELAERAGLTLHTHVNENRGQADKVAQDRYGRDVEALDAWGALGPRLVMAHCVWLSDAEIDLIAARGAHVAHCPSANLKLASGIAPVPELIARGVNVGIGTDGAACNNTLDAWHEARLAALVHRPRCGPAALDAATVLRMATIGGARALGLDARLGSLEVGKIADLQIVTAPEVVGADSADLADLADLADVADLADSAGPAGSRTGPVAPRSVGGPAGRSAGTAAGRAAVAARLAERYAVYAASAADVRDVLVGGRAVVTDGTLTRGSRAEIQSDARQARAALLTRVGGWDAPDGLADTPPRPRLAPA